MARLPLFISKRYLFAKKSHNAINIITLISVVVVAVGSFALILIMSVFNGLEGLIEQLYNSVEPEIEISPAKGKFIDTKNFPYQKIRENADVMAFSEVLYDMALAKYQPTNDSTNERQLIVNIKGVKENYRKITRIDSTIVDGGFLLKTSKTNLAVLGNGVAGKLRINLMNFHQKIFLYYPRADASETNPLDAFNIEYALPAGVFSVQQEIDDKIIFVDFDFASTLMNASGKATSIELVTKDGASIEKTRQRLQKSLGNDYVVKDRKMLNETIYKITRGEKWSSFMILSFILLIATFNVVGSVTVLIIEKKKDIITLRNIGASSGLIKRIFFSEGVMISFFGGTTGLILGIVAVIAQQHFKIVPMEGNFAVEAFPVSLRIMDVVAIFTVVNSIGILATLVPVNRISSILSYKK